MEISSSPKSTTTPIPNDVIVEILSWAPANSLWRFKWACKYWFDLIRNPKFVKFHLLRHSTTSVAVTSNHEDHNEIINNTSFLMPTRSHIVHSMRCMDVLNQSSSPKTVKMDYYSFHPLSADSLIELEILGSCNGLIYFHRFSSRVHWNFLWNPSTRELKELPEPNRCVQPDIIVHGFGYDHIIDDYKVVRVTYFYHYNALEFIDDHGYDIFNGMGFYTSKVIDVYTLGSNSWSTIKSEEYGTFRILDISGVYLNGILHWMKMKISLELGLLITITSFDIAKDENREIQLPNSVSKYFCFSDHSRQKYLSVLDGSDHKILYMSVLDESLCIFHMNDYDKGLVDVWMMKVYGMKESWTKLFTIDMKPLRKDFVQLPQFYLNPLMYRSKDGGILMVFGGKQIVAYDPKKKKARYDHNIEDCHYKDGCVAASYIGYLVSLNSGKYLTAAGSITTITAQTKRKAEKRSNEEDTKMKTLMPHISVNLHDQY